MSHPESQHQPLTPVVFHILLAIAGGACHGYAIMKHVEETSGRGMGPGTIYGSIQRMEESGLVREQDRGPTDRRRLYALTDAGRSALRLEAGRISRLADLARRWDLVPSVDG